jgi:hypothetical protein
LITAPLEVDNLLNDVISNHLKLEFSPNSEFFKKELEKKIDLYVESVFKEMVKTAQIDIKSQQRFSTCINNVHSCKALNAYIQKIFRTRYDIYYTSCEIQSAPNYLPLLPAAHYKGLSAYCVNVAWQYNNPHIFAPSYSTYIYTPADHLKEILKALPDDVVFVVDGDKIATNKALVSQFSDNLKAMFESGMKERGQTEIAIQEDSASFNQMIKFMKNGEIPPTVKTPAERLALYGLAKTYLVTSLEKLLLNDLLPWINDVEVNSDNFVEMFDTGFIYDFTELTKKCLIKAEIDDKCRALFKSKIDKRHQSLCLELSYQLKTDKVHAVVIESLKRP